MLQPNKILVIRFSSLGDLILTSPIFRELRRIFPGANLNLLTSVGFGDVLDNNHHLDRIIKHPRKENFEQLNQLIEELQAEDFDLIYDAPPIDQKPMDCVKINGVRDEKKTCGLENQ